MVAHVGGGSEAISGGMSDVGGTRSGAGGSMIGTSTDGSNRQVTSCVHSPSGVR